MHVAWFKHTATTTEFDAAARKIGRVRWRMKVRRGCYSRLHVEQDQCRGKGFEIWRLFCVALEVDSEGSLMSYSQALEKESRWAFKAIFSSFKLLGQLEFADHAVFSKA
jgi:hypothetical protein